jgi:hypothetical protein
MEGGWAGDVKDSVRVPFAVFLADFPDPESCRCSCSSTAFLRPFTPLDGIVDGQDGQNSLV